MKFSIRVFLLACAAAMFLSMGIIAAAAEETQISMVVTAITLTELESEYPNLKKADLTGSTCYSAIESYKQRNPDVDVVYTVSLGGIDVDSEVESLTLQNGEYDYPSLRRNLQYLRSLKSLTLENSTMFLASFHELQEAYPDIDIHYTINVCGVSFGPETEEMDLSGVNPEELLKQTSAFSAMPLLKTINLMDASGNSPFTLEQAAQLQKMVPNAFLNYSFVLFNQKISTSDEEVLYHGMNLANIPDAVDYLRQALSLMKGCNRFVLDSCGFDNETMASLREEFRDTTKLVWRIWYGQGSILTDRKVIRHVYDLTNANSTNLIYCEDAEFIDFGHNETLSNCEYVSKMPKLRAIILSGSMISDLTPFANCESLEFLEIAYCGYVADLSPLANCKNLKRLNIAYTKVVSLDPLNDLDLDVLVTARSNVTLDECARYAARHPDCIQQRTGDAKDNLPYGYPWRYERNGDPNEYYALLMEQFHYPNTFNTLY